MAGRGPAPKDASRRVRRNADPVPTRALKLVRQKAPALPALGFDEAGKEIEWHIRTRDWWRMWTESQLSNDFTASDWTYLLDTALLHHAMWSKAFTAGGTSVKDLASEVRLREAKFGATPEDRARLRIVFEEADAAEDRGQRRRQVQGVRQPKRNADPRSALGAS